MPKIHFTPEATAARHAEMLKIAGPIVKHYQTDLDRDLELMSAHPETPRFLWVPYECGTHLASLTPHGKNWAAAIADQGRTQGNAYFVTPTKVTPATWPEVDAFISELPDAHYRVNTPNFAVHSTKDQTEAFDVSFLHAEPTTITETNTGVIVAKHQPHERHGLYAR